MKAHTGPKTRMASGNAQTVKKQISIPRQGVPTVVTECFKQGIAVHLCPSSIPEYSLLNVYIFYQISPSYVKIRLFR